MAWPSGIRFLALVSEGTSSSGFPREQIYPGWRLGASGRHDLTPETARGNGAWVRGAVGKQLSVALVDTTQV